MNFETQIHKLPCGYRDPDGVFYTHVECREMSGAEEDLLTDRKKLNSGAAFDEVIANCCSFIRLEKDEDELDKAPKKKMTSEDALNMRQGDRFACFVWMRRVSYGDLYKFQIRCPDCQKNKTFTLDLGTLAVTYMPTPDIDHYDVELPRCGDTITFKINTGKEERKMEKMQEQNPGDAATINLATRLEKVNGESVRPTAYLKSLVVRDRNAYRKAALDAEGYIENEVELECQCGISFKTELPIQRDFFSQITE